MSKLNDILEDQYATAKRAPGQTIVRKLARGLRVEMRAETNAVHVTLTRDSNYPSTEEWRTIYRHLPFAATFEEPKRYQVPNRCALTAKFQTLPADQLKFL